MCGLKWSQENNQLASGGNDNKIIIWDRFTGKQTFKFNEHIAAVKALAWSPH